MHSPAAGSANEGSAALGRLIALGLVLLALVVAGSAALLLTGSKALDEVEARQQRQMAEGLIARRAALVNRDLHVLAFSPKAVNARKAIGPLAWAQRDLRDLLVVARMHEWTLVLDEAGHVQGGWSARAGWIDGARDQLVADSAPLLRRMRWAEAVPGSARSVRDGVVQAWGLILSGGVPYLAAATAVPADAGQPGVILLSAQRLDREVPANVERLGGVGARIDLTAGPAATSIALHDIQGRTVGRLVWSGRHPGWEALREAAPALGAGAAVLLALIAGLGLEITRVARKLAADHRAREEALRNLAEARDMAEAGSQAKSLFLANMSHEIRTPLNGVLGMTQVLARSNLSAADREKLQLIQSSGETLLALLNDLLDLSKIEADCLKLERHEFDLAALITSTTRPFALLAQQKDLGFRIEIDPALAGFWRGDSVRLRQVIGNLASNAVKFTEAGEVRVSVRATSTGLRCEVADTGPGISRENLERLFQRFVQLHSSRERDVGGAGLGLAISHGLVRLMGGAMTVESVLGQGSLFAFEIPLEAVQREADLPAGAGEAAPVDELRILAAEDNKTNQLILTALLQPLGFDITFADDGQAAVEAFRSGRFDLVLMDVRMPVMDGVEASRRIRALEDETGRPRTPILALSANVMSHQIEDYLAAGMDGCVAKPIQMAELMQALQDVLSGPAAAAEAA